jgi:hypothetical protein
MHGCLALSHDLFIIRGKLPDRNGIEIRLLGSEPSWFKGAIRKAPYWCKCQLSSRRWSGSDQKWVAHVAAKATKAAASEATETTTAAARRIAGGPTHGHEPAAWRCSPGAIGECHGKADHEAQRAGPDDFVLRRDGHGCSPWPFGDSSHTIVRAEPMRSQTADALRWRRSLRMRT